MNKLSEIALKDYQIAIVIVPMYSFNQKVRDLSNEVKDLEAKEAEKKDEYLEINILTRPRTIKQKKEYLTKLMTEEQQRFKAIENRTKKIADLVNRENDLFNLDFLIWNYAPNNSQENNSRINSLKTAYERVRGPEARFEVQPRLWHNLQSQEIITPLWVFMDLTLHHEKKFNLLFLMEDEEYWVKKFFASLRAQRKMKLTKIQDITVMILDF